MSGKIHRALGIASACLAIIAPSVTVAGEAPGIAGAKFTRFEEKATGDGASETLLLLQTFAADRKQTQPDDLKVTATKGRVANVAKKAPGAFLIRYVPPKVSSARRRRGIRLIRASTKSWLSGRREG
jgi:hypothetical protein